MRGYGVVSAALPPQREVWCNGGWAGQRAVVGMHMGWLHNTHDMSAPLSICFDYDVWRGWWGGGPVEHNPA